MTLIVLGVALGALGYLTYKQIGWSRVTPYFFQEWNAMLNTPDEPAMPPRRNRKLF